MSHNGHPLSDVANFGKLALICCSACELGWPLTLPKCRSARVNVWLMRSESGHHPVKFPWRAAPHAEAGHRSPCGLSARCPQRVRQRTAHTTPAAPATITYTGRSIGAFNEFAADPQKAVAENLCG
ncbi:MAG: hypothetical protein ACWA66_19505 [Methylibium petroleiphilum]